MSNSIEFRMIGRALVNVNRLLVIGYASDENRQDNLATLVFDSGEERLLQLNEGESLAELIVPGHSPHRKEDAELEGRLAGFSSSETGTMASTASKATKTSSSSPASDL